MVELTLIAPLVVTHVSIKEAPAVILGGVILLLCSILVLLVLPLYATSRVRSTTFRYWYKLYFWFFFADCLILGWIGGKNIEPPFYLIGQLATFFYFFYLIVIIPSIIYLENKLWNLHTLKKHRHIVIGPIKKY